MGKGATALGILLVFVLLGIVIFCVMEATGTDSRASRSGSARQVAPKDPAAGFSRPAPRRIKPAGRTTRSSRRASSSRNSAAARKAKSHRVITGRTSQKRRRVPPPAVSPARSPAAAPTTPFSRLRPQKSPAAQTPANSSSRKPGPLAANPTGGTKKRPSGPSHVAPISISSTDSGVYRSSWPSLEPRNPLEPLPRPTVYSPPAPGTPPASPRNAISPAKRDKRPVPSPRPRFVPHTVKEGDSLWQLAETYLHDGSKWREIVKANPGLSKDGSSLRVGQKIRIPLDIEEKKPDAPPKPTIKGAQLYTIEEGDTLWDLAKYFYGDPSMPVMKEILAANPGLDPDVLPLGRRIQLPPIPGKGPKRVPGTSNSLSAVEIK